MCHRGERLGGAAHRQLQTPADAVREAGSSEPPPIRSAPPFITSLSG